MVAVRIIQWIGGIAGLGALVLGLLFWIANINLTNIHMLFGILIALALLVLGIIAVSTRGVRMLGVVGIVYALILPAFGLTQRMLLIGDTHWLIRALHLLVGLGALALVGILGNTLLERYKELSPLRMGSH